MKILKTPPKRKFIRIMMGSAETGCRGIKKPTKTLSVQDATVDQVFNTIKKAIEKG